MTTSLAIFAVILSIGTFIALLFVLGVVITVALPALKHRTPAQGITDAGAACDMCIHCGKQDPTGMFGQGIDHAIDCPTITDLWPVLPRDIADGLTCEICTHVLQIGDTYTTSRDVRCIGCTFTEEKA